MPRRAALMLAALVLCPVAADAGDVRTSSIGYVPARAKHATVAIGGSEFDVKRAADGAVVFHGPLGPVAYDADTGELVSVADFSAFGEPGRYYLQVGATRSPVFAIAEDAVHEALRATMIGFYGWRCNTSLSLVWKGTTFAHEACHMDDAHTDYATGAGKRDGTKGWHDAGDYGKYVTNAGVTVGAMLSAFEQFPDALVKLSLPIPESGGAAPDYLAEIRWELEWLLKMAYTEGDGRVSHKLTSLLFDAPDTGWVVPEKDLQERYFVPYSTQAAAQLVGTLAKAARVYAPYDAAFADKCLAASMTSYAWLQKYKNTVNPSQRAFQTGSYVSFDKGDRIWAAAELWETTGAADALADFEKRIIDTGVTIVSPAVDWYDVTTLGSLVYARSKRDGRNPAILSTVQQTVIGVADTLAENAAASGYGRALGPSTYGWGSNGVVARTCMILETARELSGKDDYHDVCFDQVAWLFGRNTYDRSFVTGVGKEPPLYPHHRPSASDGIAPPWPGLLVGGGGDSGTGWEDSQGNYTVNEVAINWNGALAYALAAFLDADSIPARKVADAAVEAEASPVVEEPPELDLSGYALRGGCSTGRGRPSWMSALWAAAIAALAHKRRSPARGRGSGRLLNCE